MRKLGESKPAAAKMAELEEMFAENHINKSSIRFSGLDGTNAMSCKIQQESPYTLYINCCNQSFVLCLIHLIKECPDLQAVDTLILSIWKIFNYSSVKQTNLKTPRLLKA